MNTQTKNNTQINNEINNQDTKQDINQDHTIEQLRDLMAKTDAINAEIDTLREIANDNVNELLIAREFVNNNLLDMPKLIEGEYEINYVDNRGVTQKKKELKNNAIWIMALQTTIEVGHTTNNLLGDIIYKWTTSTINTQWTAKKHDIMKKRAIEIAAMYTKSMIELDIINKRSSEETYVNNLGQEVTGKVWRLTDNMKEHIEELRKDIQEQTHYKCAPLRNKPLAWTDMETGIGANANMRLIPKFLGKSTYVNKYVLQAVNKLQSVPFRINKELAMYAHKMLMTHNLSEEDRRLYNDVLKLRKGIVYFAITMDQRGRMYYRGGLLTPQGEDFCKALFQFANAMELGARGLEAIAIHTANMLGYSGVSLKKRKDIVWKEYKNGAFNNITVENIEQTYPKSDKFQAFVAIKEFVRVMVAKEAGECVKTLKSNLVCHQDGTCNGLQHIAAITKDRTTAEAVNLVASTEEDTPSDIYALVANEALNLNENELNNEINNEIAIALLNKYGRDLTKKSVMVKGYGAGDYRVALQVIEFLEKKGEINDKTMEQEGFMDMIGELANSIAKAINNVCPAIDMFTNVLKQEVQYAMSQGLQRIQWKTQDNFLAITQYKDIEDCRVRANNFNAMVKGNKVRDDIKTAGALAPNLIHSIDAMHLRLVINACEWDLVTVHDSIGSHAATFFDTARVVREKFVEIHNHTDRGEVNHPIMESLAECLDPDYDHTDPNDFKRVITFQGNYNVNEVLNSSYIFS